MTFNADERSVSGSLPIELYRFTADGTVYRRTSHRQDYVFMGDTYASAPGLGRKTTVRASLDDKPPELLISLDERDLVVQENCYDLGPVDFAVRIYRIQPSGSVTWWDGKVAGTNTEGSRAEFRCPSVLDDAMQTPLPTVHVQRQCNHFLYDEHCRVDPAAFTDSTTVVSVDVFDVEVTSVGGHPSGWYTGGTISNAAGERRLIVEQTLTSLFIFQPFRQLSASDTVSLRAACSRDVITCRDKFNNVVNFGGYPFVPIENVWRVGFRGIRVL